MYLEPCPQVTIRSASVEIPVINNHLNQRENGMLGYVSRDCATEASKGGSRLFRKRTLQRIEMVLTLLTCKCVCKADANVLQGC